MGQFNFILTARRTMVPKLVASSLVLIPALIWADKLVHPVAHGPVHHAAAGPYHPAPYGPHAPAPAPHGYGYCDPKAPPKCAEGSDLPYCVVDKEYPASDVDYAKITRAVNVEGYWRVILQHIPDGYGYGHYNYTQTTRLETCLFPDSACRLLAPCYQSKCTQKFVYHRMLSLDPC